MNKAVLVSIKPELCKLIADGEKTIEVRKTRPKLKPPFKCYIYQTKELKPNISYSWKTWARNGKVIGEFVCDKIDEILPDYCPVKNKFSYSRYRKLKNTMLDENEILNYGKGKWLYGWHISDLKIYDEMKELSEFLQYGFYEEWANWQSLFNCSVILGYSAEYSAEIAEIDEDDYRLARPPQSWCYVEEL